MRVYWLCEVIGEPGAEATPFWNGSTIDWADNLDHSRGAEELVGALDSTFRIIEGCLDRWTPDMIGDAIQREYDGTVQVHSRSSILQRLLPTRHTTAVSCHRRSGSTASRRSTSGVPTDRRNRG
ncbi:MAG: hypothetical protein ACRDGJ_00845 [Candidatus Limnocylindria bacterium]